jgi:vacuolar-type H+-ATPase subunit I/STV1
MTKLLSNAAVLVLLVFVWLRPALALAGDGGSSDGSEFIQPGAITALVGYVIVKINQAARPLKRLADKGQLKVTTEGYEEQQAEFGRKLAEAKAEHASELAEVQAENDRLRAEAEKLRAVQEMASEIEDIRRQSEARAARLAEMETELDDARDKLEAYESLVEFEQKLNGESYDDN